MASVTVGPACHNDQIMTTPPGLLDVPSVIPGPDGRLQWIPGSLPVPVPSDAATMTVAEWLGITT